MSGRVAVIGAGAWGTALAVRLADAGRDVSLWARDPRRAAEIAVTRENARLLPGVTLPYSLRVTADAAEAMARADAVLLAVPVQGLRGVAAAIAPCWPGVAPAVLCAKGIDAGTLRLPHETVADALPGVSLAALTGPNFAHEIAAGLPAAAVLAAPDEAVRDALAPLLGFPRFRLYPSPDLAGAALGGAAKNVIAIAAGVVEGLGLGENARAALITRGVAELTRFVLAEGGRSETAAGLSGLGDLVLTCTGGASRNHSLGIALGRGETLEAVLAGRAGVTEGVATAPALVSRAAGHGVELPIAEAVAALLAGRDTARALAEALLARSIRGE
ncbi:NAD(P)H-dependent glycerol-3-phosphate dehydrogenase [Elioraea rosea]|uniref:NAD(P)H-dependent glycerol-3-phosphate dehydrogenase n=1 Tax=Elioraea rosea TaxID=2492390 RepID=UPI00118324E3|nr:NAD(P)H-dependent glycerol-3-phosphate dehydrogenase [Elioraea rosea]